MTTATTIAIQLNGATREVASETTLLALIEEMKLDRELVAVELNQNLVPRRQLGEKRLEPGDQVEVVEFVGGG
jgi:sulfur carrier protein